MTTRIPWVVIPNGKRELLALNVFGLSTCRFTKAWHQTGEDNAKGDHLAVFSDMDYSVHAAIDQIRFSYLWMGFFIPAQFGNHWAGDKTGLYGKNLARVMKAVAWIPQRFKTAGDSLLRAIAVMENGDPCRNIPVGYFKQFIEGLA